ncbi:winged helix-turn-helix transcriptional regulator [Lysinibacillus fusiformis]|uniref:winged helix-turn-helix transcriptional regulator n=1 Tax=Lysinibacillus fusiformis TaxID=28031 RepID=UPI00215B48DC|nr:winged helix-turn-helix transcriptional regulator [Lysinibacillus fusiformis]MCR8853533.1 winged helix-turn-helix transcriptional regulator [Lysinibacillus fusiformis]WKT75020.1 winged helix-turn-helix transcriptional regulator [Lysinibacillus fusiformis]
MTKNTKFYIPDCGLTKVQQMLGGKWKLLLLWYLSEEPKRFGEIRRTFPDITESMLTKQLRELEQDKLIHREVFKVVPPKVEYSLTDLGLKFSPIIEAMHEWGEVNLKN